jgi:hypothetical protein
MSTPADIWKRRPWRMLIIVVIAIAGCAPAEPIASGDAAEQGNAAPTAQSEPAAATDDPCLEHSYDEEACLAQMEATARPTPEAGTGGATQESEPSDDEDEGYDPDYSIELEGAVWRAEGVRLRITHLALTDRDTFCGTFPEFEEPEACYADIYEGETIVSLDMRVVNESGRDIDLYPDQAVLVLGDEQIEEASMLGPDAIGGTFREGTRQEGQAWWLSEQDVDDVHALGEMRVIIGSPNWTDDFEPVTGDYDDIDLTVTW